MSYLGLTVLHVLGVGDGVTLLVVDSLVGSLTLLLVHGVTLVVIDRVVDRLTLEIMISDSNDSHL